MSWFIFFSVSGITILQSIFASKQPIFQEVEVLAGYNITASILEGISKYEERMSDIDCAIQCLALDYCNSFFYNSITKQCQFHTEVFLANTRGSSQPGTVYFYSTATTPSQCPTENRFKILGSGSDVMCVRFHGSIRKWSKANATCAKHSTNGRLAVLNTAGKDFVTRNAGMSINSKFGARVYFGMTTAGWIDGSPLVYSNWKYGPTFSLGAGECAAYDRISGWVWIAVNCSYAKNFVCQIPL